MLTDLLKKSPVYRRKQKMIETIVIAIVSIMNIGSIFSYCREDKEVSFILKALADGISLVFVCTH